MGGTHPLARGVSVLLRPLDAVLVGLVCLVVPAHSNGALRTVSIAPRHTARTEVMP